MKWYILHGIIIFEAAHYNQFNTTMFLVIMFSLYILHTVCAIGSFFGIFQRLGPYRLDKRSLISTKLLELKELQEDYSYLVNEHDSSYEIDWESVELDFDPEGAFERAKSDLRNQMDEIIQDMRELEKELENEPDVKGNRGVKTRSKCCRRRENSKKFEEQG